MIALTNIHFKKIIILFWTIWWLIACWTDIIGAFAHLGMLNATWAPDGNYPFLIASLKMYPLSAAVPPLLFIAIIIGSCISFAAFFWAMLGLSKPIPVWLRRSQMAFIISLTFWFLFFLADQMVMKFDLEENHMVQGGFELLTFLAFYILP